MSMREFPTSGYVVPLATLKTLLPTDKQEEFENTLEDLDAEEIGQFLTEHLPKNYLPDFTIYRPSDEDTVDEPMEQGEYYAVFDESDLYEKKPTKVHAELIAKGVVPTLSHWSVWG